MTSQFTAAEQGPVVATSSKPDLVAATRGVPFPRTPADLDLEALTEITARDGFAVFDPGAPGGFRELNQAERELLDRESSHPPQGPDEYISGLDAQDLLALGAEHAATGHQPGLDAVRAEIERRDDVARRTADPAFPYLPSAEWGDPGYREPRSDAEAAARIAAIEAQYQREMESDHQRAVGTEQWHPQPTEVEDALVDAEIDEHYSALAHDDDTEPTRRRRDLEALDRLRPLPELEPELTAELDGQDHDQPHHEPDHDAGHGPDVRGEDPGAAAGLAMEDTWFRSSLQDVVPADAPDRDAVIDRAVACARERFVEHGEITYPEHALALSSTDQPETDQPAQLEVDHEIDQELDEPEAAPEPEQDEEPEL